MTRIAIAFLVLFAITVCNAGLESKTPATVVPEQEEDDTVQPIDMVQLQKGKAAMTGGLKTQEEEAAKAEVEKGMEPMPPPASEDEKERRTLEHEEKEYHHGLRNAHRVQQSTVSSKPCNPQNGFTCAVTGQCYSTWMFYRCRCDEQYEGVSCDLGPEVDSFDKMPSSQQKIAVLAAEIATLAYSYPTSKAEAKCPGIQEKTEDFKARQLTKTAVNFEVSGFTKKGAGLKLAVEKDTAPSAPPLDNGLQTHSGSHKGIPFIAFRGTDSHGSAWQDAKFGVKKITFLGQETYVHRGFWGAVVQNRDQIEAHFAKVMELANGMPILISGHSLGGAIANVVAAYLRDKHPQQSIILMTFGSPRVGDARFARFVEENTLYAYRFVNAQDVSESFRYDGIVQVPESSHGLRTFWHSAIWYQHAGTQITMGLDDGTPQVKYKSRIYLKGLLHKMGTYMSRVKHLAKEAGAMGLELCPEMTTSVVFRDDESHE